MINICMRYDVYILDVAQRVPFASAIRQFNKEIGLAEALERTREQILVYDISESEKSQLEQLVGSSATLMFQKNPAMVAAQHMEEEASRIRGNWYAPQGRQEGR
jgi:hypothetical protein